MTEMSLECIDKLNIFVYNLIYMCNLFLFCKFYVCVCLCGWKTKWKEIISLMSPQSLCVFKVNYYIINRALFLSKASKVPDAKNKQKNKQMNQNKHSGSS
jgi:hypothetical protein